MTLIQIIALQTITAGGVGSGRKPSGRKPLDIMWMVHPKTHELMLKPRTKALSTHAEWLEKLKLIPNEDVMYDPEKEHAYDKISRGDLMYDKNTSGKIYHEQHTSKWEPQIGNVKDKFLSQHPEYKGIEWKEL